MIIGDGDDDLTQESKDELSRAKEVLGINFVAKVKNQRLQIALQRIAAEKDDVDATIEEEECAICLDSPNDPVVTQCGHIFCRECIGAYTFFCTMMSPLIVRCSGRLY